MFSHACGTKTENRWRNLNPARICIYLKYLHKQDLENWGSLDFSGAYSSLLSTRWSHLWQYFYLPLYYLEPLQITALTTQQLAGLNFDKSQQMFLLSVQTGLPKSQTTAANKNMDCSHTYFSISKQPDFWQSFKTSHWCCVETFQSISQRNTMIWAIRLVDWSQQSCLDNLWSTKILLFSIQIRERTMLQHTFLFSSYCHNPWEAASVTCSPVQVINHL